MSFWTLLFSAISILTLFFLLFHIFPHFSCNEALGISFVRPSVLWSWAHCLPQIWATLRVSRFPPSAFAVPVLCLFPPPATQTPSSEGGAQATPSQATAGRPRTAPGATPGRPPPHPVGIPEPLRVLGGGSTPPTRAYRSARPPPDRAGGSPASRPKVHLTPV